MALAEERDPVETLLFDGSHEPFDVGVQIRASGWQPNGRHAVARQGMTREEANELALRLLAKYEKDAGTAPMGMEYQECYDVAKAIPTQDHLDMYRKVKDELAEMGIDFPF